MELTAENFARMVDAAAINPTLSFSSQLDLVEAAKKYGYKQVYGLASYYPFLLENLKGTATGVGGGVGSSLGAGTELTAVKVFETKTYMDMGIDEIDMWMNIAALKNSEFDYVVKDIKAVRDAMLPGHILKVIIEPAMLTPEQIETAVKLAIEGGADFVKAGTGLLGACTLEHARLMLRAADGKIKVKCSGGIRELEIIKEMVDMGVARFGMGVASSIKIINELKEKG